jgi:hypothetical protein
MEGRLNRGQGVEMRAILGMIKLRKLKTPVGCKQSPILWARIIYFAPFTGRVIEYCNIGMMGKWNIPSAP